MFLCKIYIGIFLFSDLEDLRLIVTNVQEFMEISTICCELTCSVPSYSNFIFIYFFF